MRRIIVLATLGMLTACGFNGTDPDPATDRGRRAQAPRATPAPDPDLAAFEQANIADPDPRPIMQLQVVLDRQGFGPGVIDGGMGLATRNAIKGFQEAIGLRASGELDEATTSAMAQWQEVPATRVVRIPEGWGRMTYAVVPDNPAEQAKLEHLGYASLEERLAERFHTTPDVLRRLNPGGQPAGQRASVPASGVAPGGAQRLAAASSAATAPLATDGAGPMLFRAGQLVRVPNIGLGDRLPASEGGEDWARTLASLGVSSDQPDAARLEVDKSDGMLRVFDARDQLIAAFTVTTGSQHDPLPLGNWKVLGVARNPPFQYNPDLFWDAGAKDEKARLPPGPNGPVGVVWIDLDKEHYGIHGTPEPRTIGRTHSHGCVRLTNWDAARLAGMVSGSTKVLFAT